MPVEVRRAKFDARAKPSFRNNMSQDVRRCNYFTHLTDQKSEAGIKI